MLRNSFTHYGKISKIFHWFTGPIIISLIAVGFYMTSIAPSPQKWQLYGVHKATGTILLILILLRFLWRVSNQLVGLPEDLSTWQKFMARLSHYLLYIFMFIMPISGILMSRLSGNNINVFGLFTIPPAEKNLILSKFFNNIHCISAWLLSILITIHILAALFHHFIRKDNVLIGMIKENYDQTK